MNTYINWCVVDVVLDYYVHVTWISSMFLQTLRVEIRIVHYFYLMPSTSTVDDVVDKLLSILYFLSNVWYYYSHMASLIRLYLFVCVWCHTMHGRVSTGKAALSWWSSRVPPSSMSSDLATKSRLIIDAFDDRNHIHGALGSNLSFYC